MCIRKLSRRETLKKILFATLLLSTTSLNHAMAADVLTKEPVPTTVQQETKPWFVDLGVGAAFSNANSLNFFNKIGTEFTDNKTSGDRILLNGVDDNDSSFAGNVALGYMFTPNVYGKASYRYFGQHDYTGSADFNKNTFDQDMTVTAHGLFVGAGYIYDLTDRVYVDASGEIGAAFLHSNANQGANLSDDHGVFPKNTQTNFAGGLALGLGYKLTEAVDFTVTGSYHWLGSAKTDSTLNAKYMNDGESLQAKNIGVAGVTAGIRMKF